MFSVRSVTCYRIQVILHAIFLRNCTQWRANGQNKESANVLCVKIYYHRCGFRNYGNDVVHSWWSGFTVLGSTQSKEGLTWMLNFWRHKEKYVFNLDCF